MTDAPSLPVRNPYSPAIRLLLIPFLVAAAWLLEIFLLAGNNRLLQQPEPAGIALYTLFACIITGMVIPFICIRKAFVSGAVNIFQIGFRTVRRTILACSVTGAMGIGMIMLFNPFGTDRLAFANALILLLPTAAASVMVCWVLAGTHVQAFVRSWGTVFSITWGVVTTGILFTAATLAANPSVRQDGAIFWPVCLGMGIALFFFAVRDVYATIIVVAGSGVFTGAAGFNPVSLQGTHPAIWVSSLLAMGVLIAFHIYLTTHYATIVIPARPPSAP